MAGRKLVSEPVEEQRDPRKEDLPYSDQPVPLDEVCEDDRCKAPNAPIWHCVDCDSNYCNECWAYQGPHKAGKLGRDGVPHEKTNVRVVSRLKKILQPPQSAEIMKKAHDADQYTKWFGKMSFFASQLLNLT